MLVKSTCQFHLKVIRSRRILRPMCSKSTHRCFQNSYQPWTWAKLISNSWLISNCTAITSSRCKTIKQMCSKILLIEIMTLTTLKASALILEIKRAHWVEIVTLGTGKTFCAHRTNKPLETLLISTSKRILRITQTLLPWNSRNRILSQSTKIISRTTKWDQSMISLLTQEDSSRVCHLSIILV